MNDLSEFKYTGTDNLEVMTEALNYNAYLSELVGKYCSNSKQIVDFGAGIGTFAMTLHEQGKQIIAVEPDANQRQRMITSGLNCVPDISEVTDAWADVIYSINVLEHIEDDDAVLVEIYKKLKPGGRLLIYVPAFTILYSSMDQKVGHFRRYTRSILTAKAHTSGFNVSEAFYVDSMGFFASLLYKLINKNTGCINRGALRLFDRFIFPISILVDRITCCFFGKNVVLIAEKPKIHLCI